MGKIKSHVVTAVVFGALGWFACQVFGPREKPREMVQVADPAVEVGVAELTAYNPEREYVGHVEPVQETDILPQVDGYIKKVCFQEGAFVRAGDVLFEIDTEQYEAARRVRYSEVSSAEARVGVAKAEVDRAERYYKRVQSADERSVKATERDAAETALESAKAALTAAEAAVEQAKAAAALADFNMKHTSVTAPISGRIGKAYHHVGDYVSPSKSALAHVVQTDPIRVVFPVTDKDYGSWQAAAECGGRDFKDARRLRLRLADGRLYDGLGTLEFGDNAVDRETATVILRAGFANGKGALLPDAFVRVLCDASEPPQVLTVPAGAIERTAKGTHVWVLQADGTVRERPVETGVAWNGRVPVLKGLEAGTRLVVVGGFKLQDGMKVAVTP